MRRVSTDAIVYRVIKYSDSSCIAEAFTLDYGKIKLFMPKAFSKRGGVVKLVPSSIDFLQKDNSDLDKLYSILPDSSYLHFLEEPNISVRLSLICEVIDLLLPLDECHEVIYNMLLKMNRGNARKVVIYAVYAILKNSGNMPNLYRCSDCGDDIKDISFYVNDVCFCANCKDSKNNKVEPNINLIFRALKSKELYRNLTINFNEEVSTLSIFISHIEHATGRKIKTFTAYREILSLL